MPSLEPNKPPLDIQAIRDYLARSAPRDYWRSLDEVSRTPEFREYLEREFPRQARAWTDEGRRDFLKLMAASLALAGAGGCLRQPDEDIVPYVRQPEGIVPGNPLFYASAMTLGGFAKGVIVKSVMGRPIKVEGNSLHPDSLGATDVFGQASILSLYDPDRSQTPIFRQNIDTWQRFVTQVAAAASALRRNRGAGLCILTQSITSPTQARLLEEILEAMPEARRFQYEPVSRDSIRQGAELAFGKPVDTLYRFDQADVVLALDGDFLFGVPGSLRHAHDFIERRRVATGGRTMSRLYAVETVPTLTGARADHRLPLGGDKIETFAKLVAARLNALPGASERRANAGIPERWLNALVDDLSAAGARSLVYAGQCQPSIVHAVAHAINHKLGAVGTTLRYIEPVVARPAELGSLAELVERLRAESVELLLILGGNPVYDAPADTDFRAALLKTKTSIHLSDRYDETSFYCHWHIPQAHRLESWDDARAFDGTASVIQPLIAPLYSGRTAAELLSLLHPEGYRSAHELVQQTWKRQFGEEAFSTRWQQSLHDGVIADTQAREATVEPRFDRLDLGQSATPIDQDKLEVVFRPDESAWDGSYANNGWLQELPKPLTKLVWDNAALVSPATAEQLGLAARDVIELDLAGRKLRAPVWITPGVADRAVALSLGYGRTRAGRVGNQLGYNAYLLRTSDSPWRAAAALRKTGDTSPLVVTQDHWSMDGRDIVHELTLEELLRRADSSADDHEPHSEPSLYGPWESSPHAWGMAIDQTACIGCNACVVACAAENNTPIVGKSQVALGREMNWLRIDRYYRGELDNPGTSFQPMFCVHCEMAPCELVCPVGATLHDSEGLNQMVYNRCVGTRYCSNNCPYKVRRFNFFTYTDEHTPSLKLMRNPEVTVRSRGVMEKCTYCIQRIQSARITSEREGRELADGDVVTACQAACPTRAIVFGNIRDPDSEVSKYKRSPLDYSVLGELGTRPRTTHLALVRNPNPRLASDGSDAGTAREQATSSK